MPRRRFRLLATLPLVPVLGVALASAAGHLPQGSLAERARLLDLAVGAAVDVDLSPARRELAAREFTSATVENSLKWQPLSPAPGVYDFSDADAAVQWAGEAGLRVRGHTLFWDRLNGRPAWLEGEVASAPDPAARLALLMHSHAQAVVGRYAGRLAQWDVVNEPLATLGSDLDPANFFFQVLGEPYLDLAFQAAHAADPQAKLFLNETLAELLPQKFEGLLQLVGRMLARGVPIHGVGLQGHFFFAPPDRAALQTQLERVAALGLDVELTEVDIPLSLFRDRPDPLAAQAQAYADLFAACLAVPACTGITLWGVDDGDTWLDSFVLTARNAPNQPLLFDAAGQPKPAYDAVVATLDLSIADVEVDIKPGDAPNRINPESEGVVPVAILGSEVFDVLEIDPATLAFGPAGARLAHRSGPHDEDVDGDGYLDAVSHHRTRDTGLLPGDTRACISGRTFDGGAFRGCDAIQTLPACGMGVELPLLLLPLLGLRRRLAGETRPERGPDGRTRQP